MWDPAHRSRPSLAPASGQLAIAAQKTPPKPWWLKRPDLYFLCWSVLGHSRSCAGLGCDRWGAMPLVLCFVTLHRWWSQGGGPRG